MKKSFTGKAFALVVLVNLFFVPGLAAEEGGIVTFNTPAFKAIADQSHFSHAVKAGGLLFCSGSVGVNADGSLPADLETEFRNAFKNVGDVLAEAGLTFEDVVDINTFHTAVEGVSDEEAGRLFMKVHDEFMRAPWSAWTGIGITKLALPGAHVEIRVVAKFRES
jgi:enamine deaminase RidA (YjgF/YER057c/UK114 family)